MKKLFPLIIIACMALGSCENSASGEKKVEQLPLNDLQKDRLSGKVTSVRQRVYWALEKFGRMDKGKLQNMSSQDYLRVYNDDGYLIEATHYDASNKVVSSRKIEYNAARLITVEEIYKESALSERVVYTYDDDNRLIKKEKFNNEGKIKEWEQYLYGKNGLVQDEDWYKGDGTLSCKYVYIYDDALRVTEKQKYWGGGSLAQKEYYYYDTATGFLSETASEKYKNKEASFDYRYVFGNYNSFGDWCKRAQYNEDGDEIGTSKNTYNNLGHLTEFYTIVVKEIKVESAAMAEDDEAAEELDTSPLSVFTAERSGQAYEYTYDEQHHWVQSITYNISGDDLAEAARERQFYYERIITYKE